MRMTEKETNEPDRVHMLKTNCGHAAVQTIVLTNELPVTDKNISSVSGLDHKKGHCSYR